jgi:hypothetical protein
VVILAAGLSGIAQASYLAGGVAGSSAVMAPPSALLRFGVGAWPAMAAAIVAHLLFMLATERRTDSAAEVVDEAAAAPFSATAARAEWVPSPSPAVQSDGVQRPAVQLPSVQPGHVQPGGLDDSASPSAGGRTTDQAPAVRSESRGDDVEQSAKPERPVAAPSSPKRDRARAAARRHQAHTGSLPTVDELMKLADVSRGTAGTALQELREQPAPLQLITELSNTKANS